MIYTYLGYLCYCYNLIKKKKRFCIKFRYFNKRGENIFIYIYLLSTVFFFFFNTKKSQHTHILYLLLNCMAVKNKIKYIYTYFPRRQKKKTFENVYDIIFLLCPFFKTKCSIKPAK